MRPDGMILDSSFNLLDSYKSVTWSADDDCYLGVSRSQLRRPWSQLGGARNQLEGDLSQLRGALNQIGRALRQLGGG